MNFSGGGLFGPCAGPFSGVKRLHFANAYSVFLLGFLPRAALIFSTHFS